MMIDTMFIKAQRRAAKNTGDGQGNHRRRRQTQRDNDRPEGHAMSPVPRAPDRQDDDLEFRRNPLPELQTQSAPVNSDGVSVLQRDKRSSLTATMVKSPPPIQHLESAVSNLTLWDQTPAQPPKQGRNRGRNRGRSNMSKQSSPQRTFQARTSSEDQRAGPTLASTGSHAEVGRSVGSGDGPRKGLLQISTLPHPSTRNQENPPVIRLPSTEISRPAVFNGSQGSMNAIPSEDTNFGSDISRGAVQEGRLYNHKQADKSPTIKARDQQKAGTRQVDDNSQPRAQRGLLRIQPTKAEKAEPPKQEAGHRGGLLFIDTTAIKSTPNNTKSQKARGKNNQYSEFQRNAVPLRKEQEPHPRSTWDPLIDSSEPNTILRDGPKYVMTSEKILSEVKSAYEEIQNLERKIETIYDSQEDVLEVPRMERRPHADAATGSAWTAYSKIHKELLEFYHTFFTLTQHPSASSSVRRLPKKHDVLARYWKYGIIYLLEYLRQKLPNSETHMESFIFGAYALTTVLLQDVPSFQGVWMECLGDLARYLYGIERNDDETKDHWKTVASEWYLRTIKDNNGTEGRLFHHLGILSKDDHFLQLYYYSKSLMVGFSGAREAFLIMIDSVLGESASNWSEAFVRLNGMLFSRLQLDSFEDEIDVFLDNWGEPPAANLQWAILTVTNIAALYQYNRKDSRLKEALRQGRREKREIEIDEAVHTEEQGEGDTILPPSQLHGGLEFETNNIDHTPKDEFKNMPSNIQTDNGEDVPLAKIVFDKACHLAFVFLSESLNWGPSEDGPLIAVHIWLVFLTYALRYQPVVHLLERKLPWQELADFLNDVMALDEVNTKSMTLMEMSSGPVLVEDTVMQGFEWSKKSRPKNWFQNMDPLEEIEETAESSASRIKRIVSLGTQLTKICDCLQLTEAEPYFQISKTMATRIAAAEAVEAEETERFEAAQAARDAAMDEPVVEENPLQAESDEDTYVPGESEEIRTLKTKRRELKALLREQRPDFKTVPVGENTKKGSARKAVKSGYTILVFDTNLLISHLDILKQVIETGEWQIVIPLIVINELDGLKVNPAPLGPAANAAFNFVERSLLARKIRVVTQEGTGISNLTLRSQQLLSKNTEDGERSIDGFIIRTVNDQILRHTGKNPAAEKAVLITGDRSMRVIAKARGIQAMTATELRKELPKKGAMLTGDTPKKKAWS